MACPGAGAAGAGAQPGADISVIFTGLFAGKPAPTVTAQGSRTARYLWERVYPRRGRYNQHKADWPAPGQAVPISPPSIR
ncbi:conserved protein of unknown function [Pseudomonas sp. JV551A1]|nr:conserved protein of unknown function [Pseudomonas sp. JV551A1]